MIKVTRYDGATGPLIGEIAAEIDTGQAEYRLYGGCSICRLNYVVPWSQPINFLCNDGDRIVVSRDGVPVFSGRAVSVQPYLEDIQIIQISGWSKRLDEIEVVSPLEDKITFGLSGDPDNPTDHPEITTAFGVVQWLCENKIVPDTESQITMGTVMSPTYPCKLGGVFAIYSSDKLGKVLETLATMEDCVTGVGADEAFYYIPRQQVLATSYFTAQIAEVIPHGWRISSLGLAMEGNFIRDRRGPNVVEVHSRDADALEGIRSYRLANALPGSRRSIGFYAPNIRSGPAARRYARGLFRRFARFSDLKVSSLECIAGPMRFEPHLGAIAVRNMGEVVTTDLAGSIDVELLPSITVRLSLGENEADPGSGNPAKDPFAADAGQTPPDDPQVDTGDGLTDPDNFPIPSGEIDFEDGFDGDGDDFHQNPDREEWTDPPAEGIPGVDYGTDQRNPDNGKGGGSSTSADSAHWLGVITATGGTSGTPNVRLLFPNGETYKDVEAVSVYPPVPANFLRVGQGVICFYPKGSARGGRTEKPYVDGTAWGREWPARIESLTQLPNYRIAVLAPDKTTVIAYFDNVPAWPNPSEPFSLLQQLWVTFENGVLTPTIKGYTIVRSFGIGNGGECYGWPGAI